ncbi:MAG TPA: DUF401 family protein [Candidatus Hydrogenedentes bacterium]|nr:DUF401 family protein [Candidatus Hydrogenedentota bacterium]
MSHVPVLVQVLAVFALVVFAGSRKVHLGLAAALGGIAFALVRGIPVTDALRTAAGELAKPDTFLLLALVTVIMMFSSAMKKAGAMEAFSRALAAVAPSPRIALAAAPLIIGTLPMPGGAILSAPLVDAFDPGRKRGGAVLSTANYWFRHNLELAWPLYPAFILTSTMSGIPVGRLMVLNAYAAPALFILGLVFILPRGKPGDDAGPAGARPEAPPEALPQAGDTRVDATGRAGRVIRGFAPLAIVLGTYAALDALWRALGPGLGLSPAASALAGRYLPIFLGLGAASLYVLAISPGKAVFSGSLAWPTVKLAAVVAGIRVFSALLEAGGVAEASAAELAAAGIPALAAAAVLPFTAGLVTGVGFGYVGLSFPIVLGLFPAGGGFPLEAVVVLAGAFGYAGMMLSPLHVCMVVSAGHFGTGLPAMIRRFAPPLALFVALGTVWAFALAWLAG